MLACGLVCAHHSSASMSVVDNLPSVLFSCSLLCSVHSMFDVQWERRIDL